ncbi:MAG: cytochrome c oxidase subunit II [Acidimicrobiia bacterium]
MLRTAAAPAGVGPAGPIAQEIADLGWLMTWLGGAVFILVIVLLVAALVRGRRGDVTAPESAGERWVVGGGVVLPVVVVAVVFGFTLVAMQATSLETEPDGVVIDVVGHQWWWEVEYPDQGIVSANEIHIPVGRPVELRLTSVDVIHSFWVPALGGKIDLLPDKTNTYVIQADEAGEYQGACAEFCGLQHARMRFVAVAVSDEQFAAWVEREQAAAADPVEVLALRGQEVFERQECGECHTIRGTLADGRTGPDLTHLASRLTLAAGTLANTPENLREWVADPQEFKEGVEMPSFQLSDSDMEALIAYLETLE